MAFYIVKSWYKRGWREPDTWVPITWGNQGQIWIDGVYVWNGYDGRIFYSNGSSAQYELNKSTRTWYSVTWSGITPYETSYIWKHGVLNQIYYSNSNNQYRLSPNGFNWVNVNWDGTTTSFNGGNTWSDGKEQYLANGSSLQRKQRHSGNIWDFAWDKYTWSGNYATYGTNVWNFDGKTYYSRGTNQYVLKYDITDVPYWDNANWSGITNFNAPSIWSAGESLFFSNGTSQYVCKNSVWEPKTWYGLADDDKSFTGSAIWHDGDKTYLSLGYNQYELK